MAVKSITIPNGDTTSTPFNRQGYEYIAFGWPATMTGATAGFEGGGSQNGPWFTINNEAGVALAVTATDGQANAMNAELAELAAFDFIRLVSAGAEAAERVITVFLGP